MLKVAKLDQYYGGSHTLWEVDLDVRAGECTCLMGRNGVGKTTLLRAIMGLVPSAGG
ncbi:MAG: ATP-binding cassette domain-containing protein, partial [Myxococcales bacterium]|nr:ATP-binding cassette domain-containing protein [Myxococcales bacterium]